jgi:hypothetical protein
MIRLEDYLQAKDELFIDRARSPKKTPTKADSSSSSLTPTKTGKTVRIDISENKYRLFEKDSATSSHYHNDHSLSFNYSASKSAESLYRQPVLKSNRSSLLPTLSSSSSASSSSSSSPKKKQIRLPEQYFKQEESLSRLSRNVDHSITNNTNNNNNNNNSTNNSSTNNSTNNDNTIDDDTDVDNDNDIDYDYDDDSSSSRIWVILIVVVSLLLYTFANSDNNTTTSNTNDTWYSQVMQASYAVDIYHDTNDKYIIDTSTIMTINTNTIMTIIDEYVRQPVYQYINLVFDDNSKALVLVPTSSLSSITLTTNAVDYRHVTTTLATQAYNVINDYVPSDISTSYNSLYIHQMNIVTMLTSAAAAIHFYLSRH